MEEDESELNTTAEVGDNSDDISSGSVFDLIHPEDLEKAKIACDALHANATEPDSELGLLYCPRIFDGWSCWNDTPAGDTASVYCPAFVPGFDPKRKAYRICLEEGIWFEHPLTNTSWSNYTTCVDFSAYLLHNYVNRVYIAGYSISLVALSLSLFIFFYFRSLKCKRVTIHKNLFISFSLNNLMWIMWYLFVLPNVNVIKTNPVSCQSLHIILHYFLVSNYMWMFCEGLYLHTLLAIAFVSEGKILKWFFLLGWGFPGVLIFVYAAARASSSLYSRRCWMEESPYDYILSIPVVLSLILNLFFLFNIVRVLVKKLRAVNTNRDDHPTRKALRATLILIPLLGLHYIIVPFRPPEGSPGVFVYHILSAIFSAFQGFAVSLLFCFLNGEVLAILKKKWNQHQIMKGSQSYAATSVSYMKTNMADGVTLTTNIGSNVEGDEL